MQGCINVLRFQFRVGLKNAFVCVTACHEANDHTSGDPHPTDAGTPAHLTRIMCDSLSPHGELHDFICR